MYIAIFAIDPGKTTGLAWGLFGLRGTVAQTMINREMDGQAQVQGNGPVDSGTQIMQHLLKFRQQLETFGHQSASSVPAMPLVVIEDFILRPQMATKDPEMLSPVRMTGVIEGMCWSTFSGMGPKIEFQMPSEAKGFATDPRLVAWDLQLKGVRHAKDAWRHIAVRIGKEIQTQTRAKRSKK